LSTVYGYLEIVTTELQPAAERFRPENTVSPNDFVAELRRLRAQAGAPSFRELGRIADRRRTEQLPPSTTSEVLAGKRLPKLPRLEFVESYVAACLSRAGVAEERIAEETAYWRQAWRSVAQAEPPEAPSSPGRHRWQVWALVAAAFVAGTAVGTAGTRWYGATHPGEVAVAGTDQSEDDACVVPGPVAGSRDVLAGTGPWWVNDGHLTLDAGDRTFGVTVRPGTSVPGDAIIVKSAVPLIAGRHYALTFTARADRPARFRVRAQDNKPPDYAPSFERELPVGPEACHRRYEFTGGRTSSQSELTFQVGGRPGEFRLTVTAVSLVEIG
jgi:hypothetical protein